MESLYLIVPVAAIFCAIAVAAWLWANQNDQFDDLDREARRILEEEPVTPSHAAQQNSPPDHHDAR